MAGNPTPNPLPDPTPNPASNPAGNARPALRCTLCGSTHLRRHYGPLLKCANCGLICTDPALVKPVDEVYTEQYFTERNAYTTENAALERLFVRDLDRLDRLKAGPRLIDIGCGVGTLLQIAKARGYMVNGCDIAPWATDYARQAGLDVRTGALEELRYPDGAFDVAVVSHTLEHIPQPLPFLAEVRRILAPGGIIMVAVPNIAGLMAQVMRTRWAGLLPDQHLWHFTPHTLRRMLEQTGFKVAGVHSDPYLHRHSNRTRDAILVTVSGLGSALGRSDYMTAYARREG